jgi:hypothetical protein
MGVAVSPLLLCDDNTLRAELEAALPEERVHLAVNVLHAPAPGAVALADETTARARQLVDDRLMRVTRLMRRQVEEFGARRGMIVNVLHRASTPDALALAIDDGIMALAQVLGRTRPTLSTVTIMCGRVPPGAGTVCRVIVQRVMLADVPWGDAPVVLDGATGTG